MPQVLDTFSAASLIRSDLQQPSPDDRHSEAFVTGVLDQLGLPHTLSNAMMVAQALHRNDVQPHLAQEYPKHVVNARGETITVNNADEEHKASEPLGEDVTRSDGALNPDGAADGPETEFPVGENTQRTDEPVEPLNPDEAPILGEDVSRGDQMKPFAAPVTGRAPARAPVRGR